MLQWSARLIYTESYSLEEEEEEQESQEEAEDDEKGKGNFICHYRIIANQGHRIGFYYINRKVQEVFVGMSPQCYYQ